MRNVGRYPDRDTSLVHRKITEDRKAEVSMTDDQIISVIDSMTHNYVYSNQVDTEAQSKLSKSALASDAGLYIDQSDVGTAYASLVNGKVPNSQLPTDNSTHYLETGNRHYTTGIPTNAYSYGSDVAAGSITINDPGYAWLPMIFGNVEVNSMNAPPTIITVKDSSNRVVAGGSSTRSSTYNRVVISPENLQIAYLGRWTFTFYVKNRDGGNCQITSFKKSVHYFPAPWKA